VKGADLPLPGDAVTFEGYAGEKGPRATHVVITARTSTDRDDRITCRHCGKRIVPRVITDRAPITHAVRISRSVCPFCGGTVKDFRCFIATAVYGVDDPRVIALRDFRDRRLVRTRLGRIVTALYYAVSPSAAVFLTRHRWLRQLVRVVIDRGVQYIASR
jgi:hypothetical protein